MNKIRNGLAIGLLGAVALVGCGGGDDNSSTTVTDSIAGTTAASVSQESVLDTAGDDLPTETADSMTGGTKADGSMTDGEMSDDPKQVFIDGLVAGGLSQEVAECVADKVEETMPDLATATTVTAEGATEIAKATAECQAAG